MAPPIGYIAYIDEAGDDGLERVKPADANGASEWFVLSCMLIRSDRENDILPFLKDFLGSFKQHQIRHLHFRQLRDDKKAVACDYISELPVRLITVVSNKRNMTGYLKLRASQARINVTAWFYCWIMRVLIERVSDYCCRRSVSHHGEIRPVRFEISSRGGVRIKDVTRYPSYLKDQDELGLMFNDYWVPCWACH
ncbi:DUF3800 domain-containing protein [Rhodopila sp.]|uniref:DUF3800 domain-containing protein n=1 Tax=Rhodopila sp. TaxID=2480087 RepID=UPI003D09EF02